MRHFNAKSLNLPSSIGSISSPNSNRIKGLLELRMQYVVKEKYSTSPPPLVQLDSESRLAESESKISPV